MSVLSTWEKKRTLQYRKRMPEDQHMRKIKKDIKTMI